MQSQVGAPSVKKANADNWSRTSEQYAERAHKGSGMMMPLIRNYTQAASTLNTSSPKMIDIASGAGEPGISLAKQFPSGNVLITDIAPGMMETAKKMAIEAGVNNTSFAVVDAEDLSAYPDGSFDILTCNCGLFLVPHYDRCNCGLMFMPEYDRALSEFKRVLKQGGSAMFSVWGPADKTNLIDVFYDIRDAVAPGELYFADPRCLGNKGELHAAVQKAGFSNINIREVNVPIQFPKEATPMILENAVVSELLNRMKAKGNANIFQQAEDAYMASVKRNGYLKGDEMVFPENIALLVTASK